MLPAMQNHYQWNHQQYKIVVSKITSDTKLSPAKSPVIQNRHRQNCQQYKFIASKIANETKYYKNDPQQLLIFLSTICCWQNEVKFWFRPRTYEPWINSTVLNTESKVKIKYIHCFISMKHIHTIFKNYEYQNKLLIYFCR
jgi:hypothetical protein